ncbi:tRNA guanosine(34) transglycosylase Tgt [Patescibacteria group bacterium]|nr:tRNA guanosine(34) transglycosylase Tgt [Patescibacteria group bacterium]
MRGLKILKKSNKSRARLGRLMTEHGEVLTPSLVPVATQATIKTLNSQQVVDTGTQILIANTYHLHLRPGEAVIKKQGGLHKFMNWAGPVMTDSGGFQVFSLGFGRELKINKVVKQKTKAVVKSGQQPNNLKITEQGVEFRSHIDGRKIFIGPTESMKIQKQLGADIVFNFDECPPPLADYNYTKEAMARTHRWAKVCLKTKNNQQLLYGIVQGGAYTKLRSTSAKFMSKLPFDGFGIGGEFGSHKTNMAKTLDLVIKELPDSKPRHLLGIGHLADIPILIKAGVDTFDCITPTHYARHGTAFTTQGPKDLFKKIYQTDKKPLDSKCGCFVCRDYQRSYIHHLLRAREITALSLLTFHNLYFFNAVVAGWRKMIKSGKL